MGEQTQQHPGHARRGTRASDQLPGIADQILAQGLIQQHLMHKILDLLFFHSLASLPQSKTIPGQRPQAHTAARPLPILPAGKISSSTNISSDTAIYIVLAATNGCTRPAKAACTRSALLECAQLALAPPRSPSTTTLSPTLRSISASCSSDPCTTGPLNQKRALTSHQMVMIKKVPSTTTGV